MYVCMHVAASGRCIRNAVENKKPKWETRKKYEMADVCAAGEYTYVYVCMYVPTNLCQRSYKGEG